VRARFVGTALAAASMLSAAGPEIATNGAANAASGLPVSMGGAVAPGSLMHIRGVRFGGVTAVLIGSRTARVVSSSAEAIDAIVPGGLPAGQTSVVVRTAAGSSNAVSVSIRPSAPGLFAQNDEGWGPGQVWNVGAAGQRALNTPLNPAQPRGTIVLSATGIGRTARVAILVAGRPAVAGVKRGSDGRDEILIRLPAATPEGCYVPVFATAGAEISNMVTVSVRNGRGECRPEAGWPLAAWRERRLGAVVISRTVYQNRPGGPELTSDEGTGVFADRARGPLFLPPSPGTCVTYSFAEANSAQPAETVGSLLAGMPPGSGLDAGEWLSLTEGNTQRRIRRVYGARGFYELLLGGADPFNPSRVAEPLFLGPGAMVLSSNGGADVGALRLPLRAAPPLEWVDSERDFRVARRAGQELKWKAPEPGAVAAILVAKDYLRGGTAACLCIADARAGGARISPAALAHFPIGPALSMQFLIYLPQSGVAPFRARGLDQALAAAVFARALKVEIR